MHFPFVVLLKSIDHNYNSRGGFCLLAVLKFILAWHRTFIFVFMDPQYINSEFLDGVCCLRPGILIHTLV